MPHRVFSAAAAPALLAFFLVLIVTRGASAQAQAGALARVRVEADFADASLSVVRGSHESAVYVAGSSGYAVSWDVVELCTAPCSLALPEGGYTFLVTRAGGRLRAEHSTTVADGATLRMQWNDRGTVRAFGWSMWIFLQLIGGLIAATPFALHAMENAVPDFGRALEGERAGIFAAGAGTFLLGWVVGLAVAGLRDTADVVAVPGGIAF